MNRRRYLRTLGVAVLGGVAGCGGDGGDSGTGNGNGNGNASPADTPSPTPGLQQVTVRSSDVSPPNPDYTLQVRWNARTVKEISLDGEVITPREGKIVVIAFEVTAPSGQSVSLRPEMWRLGATGFQYEPMEATRSHFPETTVEAGQSVSGWLGYSIPNAVFTAQFVFTQSGTDDTVNVEFTKDEEMDIPPL